ncbi:hypothetical protein E4U53_002729 [Claviceps sorghi]|nr:hypothetical protein E4U53_002729 [Claviceps sorghi]
MASPAMRTSAATDASPREAARNSTPSSSRDYKGFVSGIFSGLAKLSVGHPFDTIKVRLQTSSKGHFAGPLACVAQTLKNEGIRGLYKGATPPLVGWMFMDSIMLGSLSVYRRLMAQHVFHAPIWTPGIGDGTAGLGFQSLFSTSSPPSYLPPLGHGIAGIFAGITVSFVAAPVEHIKARLQIQYAADKAQRRYSGPLDCLRKIYTHHGLRGVYHGLGATIIFRSLFLFWWGSYDVLSRWMRRRTKMSAPAINFWAGGLSAQIYWLASYPSDLVKQRIMTDPLGGALGDGRRRFPRWRDAAVAVWKESGWRGYWRGFLPCFLRAFPANATALLVFEGVMRGLP